MILYMYAVMLWAGNCQSFFIGRTEWDDFTDDMQPHCTELIKGPMTSDEVLI